MLINKLKEDLKSAMKTEVKLRGDNKPPSFDEPCFAIKESCRSIISMFPEIGKKPTNATDEDVIKLCKKYIKSEKIRLIYINKILNSADVEGLSSSELNKLVNSKLIEYNTDLTSSHIKHIESYLPRALSDNEIKVWIKDNIDFSQFKNKMQSMKPIMTHFQSAVDGNTIKRIIMEM